MTVVVPREGANAPQTRSFLKHYWFLCYMAVILAVSFTATVRANGDVITAVGSIPSQKLSAGGNAVTFNVASNFSYQPSYLIATYSASSSDSNAATASMSGSTVTIRPVAAGSATVTVTASVTDPFNDYPDDSATQSISVTVVAPSNPTPRTLTAVGSIPSVTLTVGENSHNVNVASYFSHSDDLTPTYSVSSSDSNAATASMSGSTVTISPVAAGSATVTVTASVTDAEDTTLTATQTISVTVAAPNILKLSTLTAVGSIPSQTLSMGWIGVAFNVASYFSHSDDLTPTYSVSSSDGNTATASMSGSTVTIRPVAAGSATVTVTASATVHEEITITATQTISVTVVALPTLTAVGSIPSMTLLVEGNSQTVNVAGYFSHTGDLDITYSASSSDSNTAITGVSGSTVKISPVAAGSATVTVTASAAVGEGKTITATQTIDVTVVDPTPISAPVPIRTPHTVQPPETTVPDPIPPTQDPPQTSNPIDDPTSQPSKIQNRPPVVVGSIAPIVLPVGDSQSVQVQFSDPDGDTLSYSVSGGNSAASASMTGNTVTVTGRAAGEATFTVTATDTHGATATQTIDVTVSQLRQAIPRTAIVLIKVSGDNQSAPIGSALSKPLLVEVRDGQQRVIQGVPVQFELAESGLTLESTPATDANGQASATLTFGDTTGEFAVEVSVTGINEPVVFTATATSTPLDVVYIDALETDPNPNDPTMNRVYGVSFSPDGQTLASAHGDRSVRMWDVETHELKRTLGGSLEASSIERRGHKSAARSVAFSPDGSILASGGRGGRVLLWDADTGRLKQFILRHSGGIWSLAFSPDGNTLAAATEGGYVYIYDVSNLKSVERKHRLRAHSIRAWSVAFSRDGRFLASSGDDTFVRLWDYETGRTKKVLRGHEEQVLSVAFGAGDTLASGSADGTVRLWDVDTGSSRILAGHTDWVLGVAFHPNGEVLASTGKDMSVRLWDTTFGVPLNTLERHTQWGRSVAISRGGILASAGDDYLIHLWDTGVSSDDAVEAAENREDAAQQQPTAQLLPNYPNPFNPETWIPYHLEAAADVSLSIYNVSGRLVRTMELGYQTAGLYANRSDAIYWDGRNTHGEQVASGVYIYRLTAGDYSASRRMVIVK